MGGKPLLNSHNLFMSNHMWKYSTRWFLIHDWGCCWEIYCYALLFHLFHFIVIRTSAFLLTNTISKTTPDRRAVIEQSKTQLKSHFSLNRLATYIFAKSSVRLRISKYASRPRHLFHSVVKMEIQYNYWIILLQLRSIVF